MSPRYKPGAPRDPASIKKAAETKAQLRKKRAQETAEAKLGDRFGAEDHRFTVEWVPVYKTFIDLSYQRDPSRGILIAENLDPDLFGIVTLSRRGPKNLGPHNEEYAIVDGGNRIAAYRYLGWETQLVQAEVFTDLSIQDEARMFYQMNIGRVKPLPMQTFLAKVRSGEEKAIALHEAIVSSGAHFPRSMGAAPGAIRFISQIEQVQRNSGTQTAQMATLVAMQAWGNDENALNGQCWTAIAYIIHHFGRFIDPGRLAAKLAVLDQVSVVQEARRIATIGGKRSLFLTVAMMFIAEYNKGLSKNRLPDLPMTGWKAGTFAPGKASGWRGPGDTPELAQMRRRRRKGVEVHETPHEEIARTVVTPEEVDLTLGEEVQK